MSHISGGSGGGGGGNFQFTWEYVSGTTKAAEVNFGYLVDNASQVVVTLPATADRLTIIRVKGMGAGGWRLSQNAGQTIIWDESASTTTGASGYLESTDDNDAVELICTVADDTWEVLSSMGNITVV